MSDASANAPTYTQGYHDSVTRSHASRTAADSAAFLLPLLKADMKILDVGCGPGTITCDFAEIVSSGSVTGIDVAPEVVNQAREAGKIRGLSNVSFSIENVLEGLSYADESFDVVYCHQTLFHLPNPIKGLTEMKRVCKPGGYVAAREGDWQSVHFYPSNNGMELWKDTLAKIYRAGSASDIAGRQLQSWARKAGFPPNHVRKSATTLSYSSADERRWWASLHIERIEKSSLREQGVNLGAKEEDFAQMTEGWRKWSADEDGCWMMVQGEILCYV
jgi:ubiquinone/menaquinone biosynthesis C-methylase UbiE